MKATTASMLARLKQVLALRWRPTSEFALAGLLALLTVGLSFLLRVSDDHTFFVVVRDVLQIGIVGIVGPLVIWRHRRPWREAGLRFDQPWRHLAISTVLAGLLAARFLAEADWQLPVLTERHLRPALYVMVVNVFEVFFFAVFVRHCAEEALGIVPSVVLAASAFSLHHAGFQPEFVKMFCVGLLFIGIFRIARNWLVLFPLWWVGGVWDVLFRAELSSDIYAVGWVQIGIVAAFVALMLVATGRPRIAQEPMGVRGPSGRRTTKP